MTQGQTRTARSIMLLVFTGTIGACATGGVRQVPDRGKLTVGVTTAGSSSPSRFHLTIASMSGSPRAVEAVTSVQASLHEMLRAIPVLQTNISHSDTQHAALVRAVLDGRPDRARRTMEEHCDDTAALLRGLVG